jgi:isopentenyl-diphosphate delta-isomerase
VPEAIFGTDDPRPDPGVRDAVVSSEDDSLILVDRRDREIGTLDKARCHDGGGILHRAFSIFILDDRGRVLLQQRAAGKRLWPGFWSNSCCSHPRSGESLDVAIRRRLRQELGLECRLRQLFRFEYRALYGERGAEHELCSVHVGHSDRDPEVNRNEIHAWRWIEPAALDAELADRPEQFTPWLHLEWQRIRRDHGAALDPAAGDVREGPLRG